MKDDRDFPKFNNDPRNINAIAKIIIDQYFLIQLTPIDKKVNFFYSLYR